MNSTLKLHSKEKLHPRNRHRGPYDFIQLKKKCPDLIPYIQLNKYNDTSIDFSNPAAVKMLNKSLLMHYYNIVYWDIPPNYLCPPIPGRADYIHHIADLLKSCNQNKMPNGKTITILDIGVGANCIYPIIGNYEYGWNFVGSEISAISLESANKIRTLNHPLKETIQLRLQLNPNDIFKGIIQTHEFFDLTICNPPFHASEEESQLGTLRKLRNLKHQKINKVSLNFGGQDSELCCVGGEVQFVQKMIQQSLLFKHSCFWFSTLVSKQSNLKIIVDSLKQQEVFEMKTIPMGQGNKISRIVAWTFLDKDQQKNWLTTRWKINS